MAYEAICLLAVQQQKPKQARHEDWPKCWGPTSVLARSWGCKGLQQRSDRCSPLQQLEKPSPGTNIRKRAPDKIANCFTPFCLSPPRPPAQFITSANGANYRPGWFPRLAHDLISECKAVGKGVSVACKAATSLQEVIAPAKAKLLPTRVAIRFPSDAAGQNIWKYMESDGQM